MKETLNEEWVMARRNRNHGLQPLKDALKACGNPEKSLKIVHLAGTNGKGSTTNFLKDILMAHDFKVGMFTSPHLVTHRDRIRINNAWISESRFLNYLHKYKNYILEKDLGMFEIDELVALNYYYDENVDYVLLETGLGGRLDQTNCVEHTILDVITTISFDHMNLLGNRIQQIAFEKAGILKLYGHSVMGYIQKEAEGIIQNVAHRNHNALHGISKYRDVGECEFAYRNDTYALSSFAQYQKANASLALEAAWMLGVPIHDEKTHEAIKTSHWAGRFEIIQEKPRVILDGAHNKEGIEALVTSLKRLSGRKIILFSALKDKDYLHMANALVAVSDCFYLTYFENERSESLEGLLGENACFIKSYKNAIQKALDEAKDGDNVVVTGSLYFISLVREYFQNKNM